MKIFLISSGSPMLKSNLKVSVASTSPKTLFTALAASLRATSSASDSAPLVPLIMSPGLSTNLLKSLWAKCLVDRALPTWTSYVSKVSWKEADLAVSRVSSLSSWWSISVILQNFRQQDICQNYWRYWNIHVRLSLVLWSTTVMVGHHDELFVRIPFDVWPRF